MVDAPQSFPYNRDVSTVLIRTDYQRQGDYMAQSLRQRTSPQYIPFMPVELLDERFDDADAELLDVAAHWNEREAVEA